MRCRQLKQNKQIYNKAPELYFACAVAYTGKYSGLDNRKLYLRKTQDGTMNMHGTHSRVHKCNDKEVHIT